MSASAGHGSETRVRAIPTATTDAVGQPSSETAGHVGRLRPVQPGFVSGSCVATNTAGELPGLSSSAAQLEAKFKHAADFGVAESRGASGFQAFGKAVDSFVADSGTVRVKGTYRGNPAILNYNPATAQVVVQATDGAFVSAWQMSPAQLQNVITKASLGGG